MAPAAVTASAQARAPDRPAAPARGSVPSVPVSGNLPRPWVRRADGSERVTSARPEHLRELLAIGLIASVIGIALGLLIDWFPTQASSRRDVDTLWDVLIIFSVPVFVLVMVVVLYCVWRFRMRPGEELLDGPPIHGNTRLEIIWTAIPAIILVALCSYAYVVADRHRGGRGELAQRPRRRRAVHLDLLLQGRVAARRSPRRSSTSRAASRSTSRSSRTT